MTSKEDALTVALMVGANVVSVVGVVIFNKMIYSKPYEFRFASSLMMFHFFCTWVFVIFARKMNWFTEKRIATHHYVKLGLAQTASVGFVNLSLLYNSVGTYQVLKFTNILVICCMEYFWKNKTYSFQIYTCLVLLVIGVCMSTVTQVDYSVIGLFHGLMGSLSTAAYQIQNKAIQMDEQVKPLQILQHEQPFTVLFSGLFALATDNVPELMVYEFNTTIITLIVISGVFAFGVNVTCYLIIGKTSPVTYGVVGHTKTCGILLFGFFFLKETASLKTLIGIAIAFGSIVWYTTLTTAPHRPQPGPGSPTRPCFSPTPEEMEREKLSIEDGAPPKDGEGSDKQDR